MQRNAELKKFISLAVLGGELAVPCNLQSATAGLNSFSRVFDLLGRKYVLALKNGSCATACREPCQVLTEAAVRGFCCVPQECLF